MSVFYVNINMWRACMLMVLVGRCNSLFYRYETQHFAAKGARPHVRRPAYPCRAPPGQWPVKISSLMLAGPWLGPATMARHWKP